MAVTSCSTKKNKWNRRVYHNLTAHYNAYFNGKEALKTAVKDIESRHIDDYSEVLDVFKFSTKDISSQNLPNFERTKKKASIVIHKHSMEFNDIEYVKWVYRAYLMIGKANFFAHEYMLAEQNFKFIISKYNTKDIKYDARMWMALAQIQQGEYEEASKNLRRLKSRISKDNASKEVVRMLPMVFADLYLKQEMYTSAIGPLKLAIKSNRKKDVKARLSFILGQVYLKTNNLQQATEYFRKTIKYNPTYIMDFNSRINIAKAYDGRSGSSKNIKELLTDMIEDSKNKEYLDQIYYVLAEVELKENNVDKAIEHLRNSVNKSVNNDKQKAFSALKLANIYFDKKEYENAQAYYDSTMMFIPKSYDDYSQLKERSDVLTELVTNLLTIKTQDSLQKIALMPEGKRNKLIQEMIDEEVRKEEEKRRLEAERRANAQFMEQNRMQTKSVTQGANQKWYFYNSSTLSFGFNEFTSKWGQRKLEDYWRISSRQSMNFTMNDDSDTTATQSDSTNSNTFTKKDKGYYLQGLPLNDSLMAASHKQIQDAFFNSGIIYREKLKSYKDAANAFEGLIDKYSDTKYKAQAYYYLYKIYNDQLNNSVKAESYLNDLKNEFPDSDFTKLLSDPDYYKQLENNLNKANRYYKNTYDLYISEDYDATIINCAKAAKKYKNDEELAPKFALLHAFALMHTSDTLIFLDALDKVVNLYPNTEQGELANDISLSIREMLEEKGKPTGKENDTGSTEKEEESIYNYDEGATHMFVVLVDIKKSRINDYKNELSNHNTTYFGSENLNISTIPLNKTLVMIGVSNFDNKQDAIDYVNTIKNNNKLNKLISKTKDNNFVISDGNYTILYKSKNVEEYKKFYKKKYK